MDKFNFDEWAELYKKDPEAFEQRRQEFLESEIMKAPVSSRPMLRILQLECDIIHQRLDPVVSTTEMLTLLANKLGQMVKPLDDLKNILQDIGDNQA